MSNDQRYHRGWRDGFGGHASEQAQRASRRPEPGKVTRTSKLEGKRGPVQRERRGGVAPPGQDAAGDVGGQASDDGPVEDWMMVALRPDLYQTPILRQSRSEVGLAHVPSSESMPGESIPGTGEPLDGVQTRQVATGYALGPRSAVPAVQRQQAPAAQAPSVSTEDVLRHVADERWDADTLAARLTDAQMRALSASDRMRLIDYVSGGLSVGNEDERTIVRLLATTPASQAGAVRGQLGVAFLQQLDAAIDFDEYRDYHGALRALYFDSLSPERAAEQMASARVFPWADPGLIHALWNVRFYYEEVELHDDGKLHVRYWTNVAAFGTRAQAVALDPFEMIAVRFLYPEEYAGAEREQTIYMPAINLRGLHRKQFRDELQTAADVGLVAAGGVGLVAAGSRVARAVAVLDLTVGAADLVIRDFRQQIASSQEGQEFLAAWDIVSTLVAVYGVARVAIEAPRAIVRLRHAWQRLRATGATRDMGDLGEHVDGVLAGADEVEEAARQSARGDAAVADGGNAGAPRSSSAPGASTTSAGTASAGSVTAPPLTAPSRKPDPDAMPGGKKTRASANDSPETIRSFMRENESAEVLAKHGYEVEQRPAVPGTRKKPDFRIEGQVFDNYAPTTDSPRSIWTTVKKKVIERQADRIILNLNDSKVDLAALTKQFADWPIADLEQVLVIHGRQVTQIWP